MVDHTTGTHSNLIFSNDTMFMCYVYVRDIKNMFCNKYHFKSEIDVSAFREGAENRVSMFTYYRQLYSKYF